MRHIGLTETQIESIGKETTHHALLTTYNLMWKVCNAAKESTGRTLAGYLRRAGKVSGVVVDKPPSVATSTIADAVHRLRVEAAAAANEGRATVRQGMRTYPIGTVLWLESYGTSHTKS
jgi:hypothetical protein